MPAGLASSAFRPGRGSLHLGMLLGAPVVVVACSLWRGDGSREACVLCRGRGRSASVSPGRLCLGAAQAASLDGWSAPGRPCPRNGSADLLPLR